MSVEYKDYYKLLGVSKDASQDEISKSFKKLARKYHPDLNPDDKGAEAKFKEANEAYEVLKDPEKRKMYDRLGPNWQHGQDFQPPPGFENVRFHFGGPGSGGGGASDFSDFFETIFGGMGGQFGRGGGRGGFQDFSSRPRRGQDSEAALELSLEEAFRGGEKVITLQERMSPGVTKDLKVNIPKGVREGAKIRLAGQGGPGAGGGPDGDLYLRITMAPHPHFSLDGNDVVHDLALAPWEAVLGTKVRVPTLDGEVDMKVPAGSDSGRKMRIKSKGLGAGPKRGDQYVRIVIKTPDKLSSEEKKLWKQLAETSGFSPR
ncbi:MAG: J domain-containing protein [Desulfovibrio sp.]|nr:MAG: J domain-containing protein [Desulfovibrio sp.]